MQARAKEMVPQDGGCPDYGQFVDSDGVGDIEDVPEPLERYGQGLYYPVSIGEVLAGRYRIEHKLGWGGFSSVWGLDGPPCAVPKGCCSQDYDSRREGRI
jgi:hypothetical protein